MELKQKQVLITIWILGNPECLRSVVDRLNITKLILFCVYRKICEAIANSLSGQYLTYLLVYNWAPLGKMINFGSFAQRKALDQWSNDPSLDHADQWSDFFLWKIYNVYFSWKVMQSRHKYYFSVEFLDGEKWKNILQSYYLEAWRS